MKSTLSLLLMLTGALHAQLIPEIATTDITCNGGNDGAISVTDVEGGVPPYTFTIPGVATDQPVPGTAEFLMAGSYDVIVQDAESDSATEPVVLTQPIGIEITQATATPSNGINQGTIEIASTPNENVLYSISGPVNRSLQPSPLFMNLPAGTYTARAQLENDEEECAVATAIVEPVANFVEIFISEKYCSTPG